MADRKMQYSPTIFKEEAPQLRPYSVTPNATGIKHRDFHYKTNQPATANTHAYDMSQIANIEKKINQTLNSFEIERTKQEMEVKRIKEEVDQMDKCQSTYRQYMKENDIDRSMEAKPFVEKQQVCNIDYSIGIIQGLQKEKKDLIEKYDNIKKSKKELKFQYDSMQMKFQDYTKASEQKIKDLEESLAVSNQKAEDLEKYINEYNPSDLLSKLKASETMLLEERSMTKQSVQRLEGEVEAISKKLKAKEIEDQSQTANTNKILNNLLVDASKHCNFLTSINFTTLSISQKLINLDKLIKYLFCEKENADKKYNKLMELHSEAIEINNKACVKFPLEAYKKLTDENNELKKQIDFLKSEGE